MDTYDKITNIMYDLLNNKTLIEILKTYSKESNLVLSIDLIDNTESVNINVLKKKTKQEFIKIELPKYKKIKDIETNHMCSICLEYYKENMYKRMLPCNHEFHKKCIDKWFRKCKDDYIHCPICRKIYDLPLEKVTSFELKQYV